MTDPLSPTRGADTLAPQQPSHIGKVGDKQFTAQQEPAQHSSTTARSTNGVLHGVKRLFRAAIQRPLPRAGSPLRQARHELDNAHERLLGTMLNGDSPHASRAAFLFTLREAIEAEAAFVAAGGRIAALHADDPAKLYMPSLEAFTFTELLLLRERLPRLADTAPETALLDDRACAIIHQALHAVDKEIAVRDQPFKAVLSVLSQDAPALDELDGALYALACAVSARERRGENPSRFLGDLAASRSNEDLENASAALASAPIRIAYNTIYRPDPRERLAVSAHDGGAGACARILKNAVDDCIRSRLVVRARLDLRQGTRDGRTPTEVVTAVLDMLAHGVMAMNGDMTAIRSQRDAQIIALFTSTLAGYDDADLHTYMATLSDTALRAVERHLSAMPAARRRALQHAIDAARRAHARDGKIGHAAKDAPRHRLSQAVESVSMRATPILAWVFARMQADLGDEAGTPPARPELYTTQSREALTRMSFDVTAQTDGTYEVSVTANVAADEGTDTASRTCKNRVAPDLRLLRGETRQS